MHKLKAKAKINLFFHITGKRSDGYHLIESLAVFAEDIYDSIAITPAKDNFISIAGGEFAHLLEGENLINKAIQAFGENSKYHYHLSKDIPVGAGLGGGSADAALVAKFLNNNASTTALTEIGADLPICYHNKATFCSGIGEVIAPITDFPAIYMVLVNPRKPLLTKDVFKRNSMINTASLISKPSSFGNDAKRLIDFLLPLTNDLTEASIALMPEIQTALDLIAKQPGCKIARMSGSGPTCFGIFTDKAAAISASEHIINTNPEFWIKYTEAN